MPQAYKPSEYLGLLRKNNPGSYDHIGDKDLLNYAIQQRPALSGELDFSEDILPTENYDPTIVDHLKQTAFNLKSMGVEMPAAVIGTAAYMLRDPLVKKAVMNSSEEWREWGKKKTDEWIQSDLGVKGYLEWQKNNPMSLKNFWHGDMMLRGISSLAPSIATTVAGGGLVGGLFKIGGAGLKIIKGGKIAGRFLTAASMEGSSEYNEAMSYLVDEKGMSPSEANEIATASAGAYSLASGALEYFQVNRAMRVLGVADDTVKKLWTTRIANKLDEAKKGKGVKSLAAVGTDIVQNSIVQGLQEGAQQTTQLMIGNVYKKYNGDIDKAFDNFSKDLREAYADPDTKESFWSSAAATLLTGGIGGGGKVASVGRRALERIKRRNANSKVEEDAHNFREPEDIDLPKSDGAILGSALIGDIGITDPTQEEQDRINEVNLNKIEDNKAQLFEELSEDPSIINEINSELSADEWFNAVDPEQNEDSHFTKDEAEVIRQAKIAADSQVEAEVIQEAQEEIDTDEFLSDVDRLQKISAPRAQETVDDEIAEAQKIDEPEIGVSQEDIDKYVAMNPNERQKELTRAKKQEDKPKQELLEALIRKDEGRLNLFTQPKPVEDKPVKEMTDEETMDPVTDFQAGQSKAIEILNYEGLIKEKKQKLAKMSDHGVLYSSEGKNLRKDIANYEQAIKDIKAGEKKEAPAKKASIDFLDKLDSKPSNKAQQDVLSAFNNIQDIVDKETRDPDLQRPKKGPKVKDNKKVASALEKRLKKQFPWVKAKALEKVFDEEGTEVAGRSFKNIVEWSKGKATLDTIPHEYAHIYVKLMKNHPVIQEGLQRFGGEEKLVQRIGEYYANRIQDKGMLARIKTWLRKFHIALKQFFGSALSDKQLSNLISEQFYQAEMPTVDLADIKEGIAYQKLNRKTELFVKRQIDEIYNNVNKNNTSFEFSPVDAISTIKSKLPDNMKYIVDDWVAIKAKTDSRFVDMYAKSIEDVKRDAGKEDREVTSAMTDSAMDRLGFDENLAALEDNEIDNSEDSLLKVTKAGLRAIGVREISQKQLANLQKDARNKNKNFDQWINDSIKRNTGVLKVKDDKARRLLKQFWISTRSEGRINSDDSSNEMYHSLQLELRQDEKGWSKGRKIIESSIRNVADNFFRIKSKVRSWFGSNESKEMASKQFTSEFIASNVERIERLLKNTSILDKKNLYAMVREQGSNEYGNFSKPYQGLSEKDYEAIEKADLDRYIREWKKWKETGKNPPKDRIVPVFTRGETSTFFTQVTDSIRKLAEGAIGIGSTPVTTVRSGMQTGADTAGLKAAKKLGIETSGVAPMNEGSSEFNVPAINEQTTSAEERAFIENKMKEAWTAQPQIKYLPRTYLNIKRSDGTVIFTNINKTGKWAGEPGSPGSGQTKRLAIELGKPYIINPSASELRAWVRKNNIKDLNVAGNREDNNRGIGAKVEAIVSKALESRNFDSKNSAQNNFSNYWNDQFNKGFITEDQKDSFLGDEKVEAETNIAVYQFLNNIYPGYLKDKGGWANILKRIKIPFTPAKRNVDMEESTVLHISTEEMKYKHKDDVGEPLPLEKIISRIDANKKTNTGDGNSITGASFFKKLTDSFGLDPNSGFAKTIMYDSEVGDTFDQSSTLMIKHNNSRADVGMVYYKNNIPVAEVDTDGNIYRLNPDGTFMTKEGTVGEKILIDMIMTGDERKIGEGKYKEDIFTIPGKAVGLIKYAEGVKTKIKFAHQWLNYVPTEMHDAIKEAYASENTAIIESLTNAFENTQNATSIKNIVKKISEMHPDDMPSNIQSLVDLGAGKHPVVAKQLATIVVGKYIQPAMAMAGQNGSSLYMAPNYRGDLKEGEIAIGAKNAKEVEKQYKKSTKDRRNLYDPNTDKLNLKMLEDINDWLKGRDFKVLAFRHPLPHLAGAVYVRVKRLHPKINVAELHHETTFVNLEGDYDGDAVYIQYPPDNIKSTLEAFFNSSDYNNKVSGINLSKYANLEAKNIDMSNSSDRYKIMEEMALGSRAIGEIATTQAIYNSIKNSIDGVYLEVGDPPNTRSLNNVYKIKARTRPIRIGNNDDYLAGKGELVDVDTYLRIYLQAATDNAKFLILSDWDYTVNSLRMKLFDIVPVKRNEKGTDIVRDKDGFPIESGEGIDFGFKQLGLSKAIGEAIAAGNKDAVAVMAHGIRELWAKWKVFKHNILELHKVPYDMRKGSVITEGKGGNLTFEDYLAKSDLYSEYLKDRSSFVINNYADSVVSRLKEGRERNKYMDSIGMDYSNGLDNAQLMQTEDGGPIGIIPIGIKETGNVGTMEHLATQLNKISESYDFDGIDPLNERESNILQANEVAMLEMGDDLIVAEESVSAEIPDFNIQLDKGLVEHHKGSLSGINIDRLSEEINWGERRARDGSIIRLEAYYGDKGTDYSFSGKTYTPNNWTPTLNQIKAEVEKIPGFTFNSVLLNKYRDGNDSVTWHSDNEPELGDNPIIASVSLGATRTFKLQRKKPDPNVSGYYPEDRFGKQLEFKLENGDLFLMHGETQDNYAHTIGKQRDVDSPRINLTFRNTGSDQVQQRRKQLIYSNKEKTHRYAIGLVKSVYRAMNWLPGFKGSVSRFQPSTWETNPELAELIENYSKTYQKFNESEKKLATHYYIRALFNTQSDSLKTKTAVSMIDHMQAFAPSTRGTGVSLLHPDVVSEYFNKFNKGLKSDRMQKQAEENAAEVETQRGCPIQ